MAVHDFSGDVRVVDDVVHRLADRRNTERVEAAALEERLVPAVVYCEVVERPLEQGFVKFGSAWTLANRARSLIENA